MDGFLDVFSHFSLPCQSQKRLLEKFKRKFFIVKNECERDSVWFPYIAPASHACRSLAVSLYLPLSLFHEDLHERRFSNCITMICMKDNSSHYNFEVSA